MSGWWNDEDESGATRHVLPTRDWSLRRAELQRWLQQQPGPQLIFVRYFPSHNVNFEWVYNHADLIHSHVIWARDLGSEHNRLLLDQMRDRTVWSLEADRPEAQLVPYAETGVPGDLAPAETHANSEGDRLNW